MDARSIRVSAVVCSLVSLLLSWPYAANTAEPGRARFAMPAGPDSITLLLGAPEYGACGDVSINGYVGADDGFITGVTWQWGDGVVYDSWFPAQHHYTANGSHTVQVTAHENTGATLAKTVVVDITNADAAGCEYTLRLHPSVPRLRDGFTTTGTWLELRDGDGNLVTTHGFDVAYSSSDPALLQVDADGQVTGAGFGHADVEAQVAGFPRSATASVVLGRFRVEPAIQLLSVADDPTGDLALYARNADGSARTLPAAP
jgi:hypothetical protein